MDARSPIAPCTSSCGRVIKPPYLQSKAHIHHRQQAALIVVGVACLSLFYLQSIYFIHFVQCVYFFQQKIVIEFASSPLPLSSTLWLGGGGGGGWGSATRHPKNLGLISPPPHPPALPSTYRYAHLYARAPPPPPPPPHTPSF